MHPHLTDTQRVIRGAHIVTMNSARAEYRTGHVVVDGNRIVAVGPGEPVGYDDAQLVDGTGCVLTPGLINTHHHLYQWITRGLAVDHTLFEWLTTLYPIWGGIDADASTSEPRAPWPTSSAPGAPRAPTTTTSSRVTVAMSSAPRSPLRPRSASGSTRAAARWTSVRAQAVSHPITSWRNSTRSSRQP